MRSFYTIRVGHDSRYDILLMDPDGFGIVIDQAPSKVSAEKKLERWKRKEAKASEKSK